MPLTEAQIIRYSRQILLREVGGAGQQRLLDAEVRVCGDGEAVRTAAAYLAAGGTRMLGPNTLGLWEGAAAPNTLSLWEGAGVREEFPQLLTGPDGITIALTSNTIAWTDCARCASALTTTPPTSAPTRHPTGTPHNIPADPVFLGTLSALVQQRLILGLGPRRGALALSADGSFTSVTPPSCAECAP